MNYGYYWQAKIYAIKVESAKVLPAKELRKDRQDAAGVRNLPLAEKRDKRLSVNKSRR